MTSTTESFSTSHLDRKSLKRPDSFSLAVTSFFGNVFQNTRGLLILLALLFLSVVGFFFWANQNEGRSHQATEALYGAEKVLDEEMGKLSSPLETAVKAAQGKSDQSGPSAAQAAKDQASKVDYLKVDVDARLPRGVGKLVEVTEKFSNTRASFEAQMQLGSIYFNHAQFEKSLGWFQKAEKAAREKLDRVAALSSVGYAQENLGKPSEALGYFQKAIALGEPSLKGDLLLAIGRCYEGLNDLAKARSIYEQVSKEFPGGEYAKAADGRKSRL